MMDGDYIQPDRRWRHFRRRLIHPSLCALAALA